MKSNEFFQEVRASAICPEGFEKIYKEFQGFQELSLNGLKELHRICEKNNIPYQLSYGSLLGAIRDGGQIPWDYDVDVFVPYEAKDRLIDALQSELSGEYYFRCPEVEKKCEYYFMRLSPKGFLSNVLHVDIFYLIGSPDDESLKKDYAQQIARYCQIRFGRDVNLKDEAAGNIKRYFSLLIKKRLPTLGISVRNVNESFKRLCNQYPIAESKSCVTADIFSGMWEFPTFMVMNTKLIDTDYGTVRVPVHSDEILKQRYGDYMTVPSLESRVKELMFHYNRIKYFVR